MKNKNCILCNSIKNIHGHHLSYDPEIVINLCLKCHLFLHLFSRFSEDQITKIREWVVQYSKQWVDGTNKYRKSKYRKQLKKDRYQLNKDRIIESSTKWIKDHPDQARETHQKWLMKNKDKVRQTEKKWAQIHPDKIKEINKKYRLNNKDRINECQRNSRLIKKQDIKTLSLFDFEHNQSDRRNHASA